MISKVSNTPSFRSAHLKYKPKAIDVRPITSDVTEEPVLRKLTQIAQGPKSNWKVATGFYETPIEPSYKTGFVIPNDSKNLIKAQIGDEEYVLLRDNPATFNGFDNLFKALKAGLKK